MKIRPVGFGPSRFKVGTLRQSTAIGRVMRDDTEDKDKGAAAELAKEKKKAAELLDEVKKLRAKNKDYETKEEAEKAAADEKQKELDKKAGDFEKLEAKLKKDVADRDQQLTDLKSKYETKIFEGELSRELETAGVTNPAFKKAALTMLKAEKKFEIGEDGSIKIETTPLTDFVKTWAGTDEGKSFVQNGNGGGGAPPKPSGPGGNDNNTKPNMLGNTQERAAAMALKFPDLPSNAG